MTTEIAPPTLTPAAPPLRLRLAPILLAAVPFLIAQTALIVRTNLFFNRYISASSLPQVTVVLLLALCLLNRLVRRVSARAALSGAELAVVFGMLLMTAAIPQAAVCENVVSVAATPSYYSTDRNHWQSLFFSRSPAWLRVTDAGAVRSYFDGLPRGAQVPWAPWVVPLLGWGIFFALFFAAMGCVGALFYRQWAERERVNFPLVILPLEIIKAGEGERRPVWTNGLFWLGALPPALAIALGDLHSYVPTVPEGQEIYGWPGDGAQLFQTPPWSALNGLTFSLWPLVIGIAYFLNSEVAVSIWAFHLLSWVQRVILAALGVGTNASGSGGVGDPLELIHWEEFGGCAMFSAILTGHLITTFRREGWPRGALAVFAAVNVGLLLWGVAAGAGWGVMLGFLLLMYLIVITLARLVAAGGLFLVDSGFTPQTLLNTLAGSRTFAPPSQFLLAGMETIYGRPDMNPAYFTLNSLRAADTKRALGWRLGLLLGLAALFVYGLGDYLILATCYHHGGAHRFPTYPLTYNALDKWGVVADALNSPTVARTPAYGWMGFGAGIVAVLSFLQYRYTGWPLSPIGFAVASSWNTTYQIWSSVFVGWLCSAAIRRWGGLKTYNQFKPLFLGLILGNMVMTILTSLVDMLLGARGGGR